MGERREPRRVGVRGREALLVYKQSYGCFEMVLSPEAKQKQIYGCFEMVLSPAKTADLEAYLHSEKFKLYLLNLSDFKIPTSFPPTAPKIERCVNSARKRNWITKNLS